MTFRLACLGAASVFAYNRLRTAKTPYCLDDGSSRRIVIVGGGISGLATAFYLTKDERNHVTLLEKNRKLCDESSEHNRNVFLQYDSTPATSV